MKEKRHKIKKLQDILRAVNADNLEAFLVDFKGFMGAWVAMKAMVELSEPDSLEDTIKGVSFDWIDDGKHEATINIEVKIPRASDTPETGV